MSWPVTLAILVLAFGSLVAAGLPLMLTILGLLASAGSLYLLTLFTPVSIWAMNFALMFALALGIDYALFIVGRFRAALFGQHETPADAVEETMDTAGKAVLFSGVTVLISLSAVMLVASPAFRSMALGIMLSVIFVLAATLTLLPAVLASSARGSTGSRCLGCTAASTARRASPPGASCCGAARGSPGWRRCSRSPRSRRPRVARTGMPSIKVVPEGDTAAPGYEQVQAAFGAGAPGALQVTAPPGRPSARAPCWPPTPAIAQVTAPQAASTGEVAMIEAVPGGGPFPPRSATRSTACAPSCRPARWSAARSPRTTTSRRSWRARRRSSSASCSGSASCCCWWRSRLR